MLRQAAGIAASRGLLPLFSKGRGGVDLCCQAARLNAAATTEHAPLKRLLDGIKYERDLGHENVKGQQLFSEFLPATLRQVCAQHGVPASSVDELSALADSYARLDVVQRAVVLNKINRGLEALVLPGRQSAAWQQRWPGFTSSSGRRQQQQAPGANLQPQRQQQQSAAPNSSQQRAPPATQPRQQAPSPLPGSNEQPPQQGHAVPATTGQAPAAHRPAPQPTALVPPAAPAVQSAAADAVQQSYQLGQVVPIIFDLETTGFIQDAHIVDIGAKSLGSGNTFEMAARLRREKGERMSPKAAEVTGLTNEELWSEDLPLFSESYQCFLEFLEQEKVAAGPGATILLIGHNIRKFDLPKLLLRSRDWGLAPPSNDWRLLDTLLLARELQGQNILKPTVECALQKLHQHFTGREADVQHRALADVLANEVVLTHLLPLSGRLQQLTRQGLEAGPGEQLQALASLSGPTFTGWIGDLTDSNPTVKRVGKQRAGKSLHELQPSQPGAPQVDSAPSAAAFTSASSLVERGGQAVSEWSGSDPLVAAEAELVEAGVDPLTPDDVAALKADWAAIKRDASLRRCLLSMSLEEAQQAVKRGKTKLTDKQREDMEAAGFESLGDAVYEYPRSYTVARPGELPTLDAEEVAVVLPLKLENIKVAPAKSGMGSYLRATFRIVDPQAAGVEPTAPSVQQLGGLGGAQAPGIRLQLFKFRRGPTYYLSSEQKKLEESFARPAVVFGRVRAADYSQGGNTWQFSEDSFEVLSAREAAEVYSGAVTSMRTTYSARGGLLPKRVSDLVQRALTILEEAEGRGGLADPLPDWLREQYSLMPLLEALRHMHSPSGEAQAAEARRRMAFQELLALQLKLLVQRNVAWADSGGGCVRVTNHALMERAKESLPFKLTAAQQRALSSLTEEMSDWPPMMCLLQGDVGCGKTAVAFLALLAAVGSGYQGAIMAPTEILAEQHYRNLQQLLSHMNRGVTQSGELGFRLPQIVLVTGSVKGKARAQVNGLLQSGEADIAVGTHALISESTEFKSLGLAIIDEQHKFGVEQRARLLAKNTPSPHVLHMSATPIPRTVALVAHGDFSQVAIDELPPGRLPVETRVLEEGAEARAQLYSHMRAEVAAGGQVYIVCPLVEGSTTPGMDELKAASDELERLVGEGILPEEQCGLLHGRMAPEEKEQALRAFAEGRSKILISTTVVEVGVDVPAASIIAVEHAERFGLAQLHQLRGRVGRGGRASTCYLLTDAQAEGALERLRVLERHSNGFEVAEEDFRIRGAGEVLGKRQSGRDVKSTLKACKLPEDQQLLEGAREAAAQLMLRHRGGPLTWSRELLACVADESLLSLDTLELPISGA